MRHRIKRVRVDALEPGYIGQTVSFNWKPYADRVGADRARMDRLRDHVTQHGILNPLIVYEDCVLIGMRRWEIAQELGIQEVDVVELLEPVGQWRNVNVTHFKNWLTDSGICDEAVPAC